MANSLTAHRVGKGIACIVAAVFLFSIADATAKWLGGRDYAAVQIAFFRYLFGLLPVAVLVWAKGPKALRTRHPWVHLLRACLLFTALVSLFTGLRWLPLAEAIAVAFTAPLFVTALAGPLLGESVGIRRWCAVGTGFFGAMVMLQPGTAAFKTEALYVVASALCFALAMLLTRRMSRSETSIAMLTYTTLGAGLASLPFLPFVWTQPAIDDMWLFLMIGIIGGLAAYLIITAYGQAPAAVIAPFDYSALIWAALWGWVIWQEQPSPPVWVGAAIIAAAGLYITHREAVMRKR